MWNKIKTWFKKNWGYFASFVGGLVAMLFVNCGRNKNADANIQRLNDKLAEYERLLERAREENKLAGEQLSDAVSELNSIRKSESEIRNRFEQNKSNTKELGELNTRLTDESARLDSGLERLKRFIEKNGTTE